MASPPAVSPKKARQMPEIQKKQRQDTKTAQGKCENLSLIHILPLLELLQVPEAVAASKTMIVGFTDMLTPSIIAAETITSAMTRFIVAVVSVTQLIYLSEVGGLILGSNLPVKLWELFVIFLERTIISLLIVCPLAHLIFTA